MWSREEAFEEIKWGSALGSVLYGAEGYSFRETREERTDQKLAKAKRLNVSVVRAKSRKKSK